MSNTAPPVLLMSAIDFEMSQPSNNIIQVGMVIGDIATGEIIDTYSVHVNLPEGEQVSQYITDLTGITQRQVDAGVSIDMAYSMIRSLHVSRGSFINPLVWGGGDMPLLREQITPEFEQKFNWPFGRRWIDVKTIFQTVRVAHEKEFRGGLGKAMLKLGMKFDGQKHNALDDARNTFLIYHELLNVINKGNK